MNYFSMKGLNDALTAVGNVVAPPPEEFDQEDFEENEDSPGTEKKIGISVPEGRYDNDPAIRDDGMSLPSSRGSIGSEPLADINISPSRDSSSDSINYIENYRSGDIHDDVDLSDHLAQSTATSAVNEIVVQDTIGPEIRLLQKELEIQKSKTSAAFAEVSSLSDDLRSALRDVSLLEGKLRQEEDSVVQWRRKCDLLDEKLKLATTKQQHQSNKEDLITVESSIRSLLETAEKFREDASLPLPSHSLKSSGPQWSACLNAATDLITKSSIELSTLRHQVKTQSAELSMLNQRLLSSEPSDAPITIKEQLQEQLASRDAIVADLEQRLSVSGSSVSDIQDQLLAKDSTISGLEERLASRDAIVADLEQRLSEIQEKMIQSEKAITDLRSQLSDGEALVTKSLQQLAAKDSEILELRDQISDGDISFRAELASAREQAIAYESSATSLAEDLQRVGGERDALRDELTAAKRRVDELEAKAQSRSQSPVVVAATGSSSQIVESQKKVIAKMEIETRQLHQVIAQLRNARKNTKETVDSALADSTSQKELIDKQQQEIEHLTEQLKKFIQRDTENTAWQDEVVFLREKVSTLRSTYDSRVAELEDECVDTHKKLSEVERAHYELQSQLDLTTSDLKLSRQDMAIKNQELENLHSALENLDKEKLAILKRSEDAHSEKLTRLKKEWVMRLDECRREQEEGEVSYRKRINELEQKIDEEVLIRRKLEIDVSSEKRKMNKTLEHALKQLQSSQTDSVDRVLVKNLILTYFKQKRSPEVLRLISNILMFDTDERVVVGLEVPQGSLLSNIFNTITSPLKAVQTQAPPTDIEGDNLAEMWLNFLLHESESSGASTTRPDNIVSKTTEVGTKSTNGTSNGAGTSTLQNQSTPPSPRRSYSDLDGRPNPPKIGHSSSAANSSQQRRMPHLSGAPSDLLVVPPGSPRRKNSEDEDPTGFKLVPQSPVFSPPGRSSGNSSTSAEVVDMRSDNHKNIW